MTFQRKHFTEQEVAEYRDRSLNGPCFVCSIINRTSDYQHHIIFENEDAIAFLNRAQSLYGYVLVAPKQHREHVVSDFTLDEYLALQRVILAIGHAVQRAVPTERLYLLSIGSKQGNAHVHWHVAPLPPGVPYEHQQYYALSHERGELEMSEADKASLAAKIRAELQLE
jgi:diadenosine tetraphosphate (Ap4A) HIT family hydrolase